MRKCWGGRFRWEGFGAWPFMVKHGRGTPAPDLPGLRTLHFFSIPAFRFLLMSWSFGSRVRGRNFGSRCCLKSKFSPLLMLQLYDLRFCSVISEKQLSILLETGQGQFGGWFCGYTIIRDIFKEHGWCDQGTLKRPRDHTPLWVPLSLPSPANICLPNICFSFSM